MSGFVIVMKSPGDVNPYWVKLHDASLTKKGRDTWYLETIYDQGPGWAAVYNNKARADRDAKWLRIEAPESVMDVKKIDKRCNCDACRQKKPHNQKT
jgi:hypothetical protein